MWFHDAMMSGSGPGCVKTPTSNFRVEILSRLRWIGKELLCQSSPKEEKGENNSAHSLLACVFTQPRPRTEVAVENPSLQEFCDRDGDRACSQVVLDAE